MLKLYGQDSPVLFELRRWYLAECDRQGQQALGRLPSVYAQFDNGQPITKVQRVLYRERMDLQQAFPDPYDTQDVNRSYWHWFEANAQAELGPAAVGPGAEQAQVAVLREELAAARRELDSIHRSRAWKLSRTLSRWAAATGLARRG